MTNPYYGASGNPATGSEGLSALMRAEFASIQAAFDLLPTLSGNASQAVVVNPGGTALTVTIGTLALAGPFATTGAFSTTFAQSASVTLALPGTSGTLATTANVATETTRAEAAEAAIAGSVATETARAEAAEGVLSTAIATETTRATTAEGVNAAAITAETARASAAEALLAPKASPVLTGTPTAPTATPGTNSTQLATTAFVAAATTGLVTGVSSVAGKTGAVSLVTADVSGAAPLASPALTGTPTVPTAAPGTNSIQAASTAFVAAEGALMIARDGSQPPTADIPMGSHKLTGLTNGSASADAVALGQLTGVASLAINALSLAAVGAITAATPGGVGNQVVNFSQFNPLANPAGYIRLPGSVTIQWGNGTGPAANITYPVAFSGPTWTVVLPLTAAAVGGTTGYAQVSTTYIATGFTAYTISSAGNGITANFFWIAIGPT